MSEEEIVKQIIEERAPMPVSKYYVIEAIKNRVSPTEVYTEVDPNRWTVFGYQ